MPLHTASTALPLHYQTPQTWLSTAYADPLALLNDHVHLEKKAAINAMNLLSYCPRQSALNEWNSGLIQIAREEVEHMNLVHKLLLSHGGQLSQHHKNTYANELYTHIRKGHTPLEQIDRLLISALIEARSCERFALLADSPKHPELAQLYQKLYHSELSHYQSFLNLAGLICPQEELGLRWEQWLTIEDQVIQNQAAGSWIHSGLAVDCS